MMFYIGITTVIRNLKEKLEFTSEFLVFLLFYLAPLWQHLFWLLISVLCQPSWTVLWVDTEIRGLEKKHWAYLNFGLSFEFWDMNKPDSKFFCPDPESERLDI